MAKTIVGGVIWKPPAPPPIPPTVVGERIPPIASERGRRVAAVGGEVQEQHQEVQEHQEVVVGPDFTAAVDASRAAFSGDLGQLSILMSS